MGVFAPLHLELFYPRPPRGGRLPYDNGSNPYTHFSIHALHEEGDSF